MKTLIKNAKVFSNGLFIDSDILVCDSIITRIAPDISEGGCTVFDFNNCHILPGLVDVHVHLREPGFSYKETIKSGTLAAAHGGYTDVCAMPNLKPVPDSKENLAIQLELIKESAAINVYPYAAITVEEKGEVLSDMKSMAENAVAFSDDGKGVQTDSMMKEAMQNAAAIGKIIAAHCEVNDLLEGGYIHKGEYAAKHSHKGICSESEWKQIERDIALAKETGVKYHVCHISTKESVELIRNAQAQGIDVTCETGPHYLTLCDADLQEDGRFKMNPPLRSADDKEALIEGVVDGTITMIATDHAPHSAEEKSKGLKDSLMGITGLECAFSVMYTHLVKTGVITLEKLVELMHTNPARRFGIGTPLAEGQKANFTVFNLNEKYTVDTDKFFSQGKSTPFSGEELYAKCLMTVANGNIVWKEEDV